MKPFLNPETRSSWFKKMEGVSLLRYGRETEETYRLSTAIRGTSIVQSHKRHSTISIDNTQFRKNIWRYGL